MYLDLMIIYFWTAMTRAAALTWTRSSSSITSQKTWAMSRYTFVAYEQVSCDPALSGPAGQ